MEIRYYCKKCGAHQMIPDIYVGKVKKCSKCDVPFEVPAQSEARREGAEKPSAPAPAAVAATAPRRKTIDLARESRTTNVLLTVLAGLAFLVFLLGICHTVLLSGIKESVNQLATQNEAILQELKSQKAAPSAQD